MKKLSYVCIALLFVETLGLSWYFSGHTVHNHPETIQSDTLRVSDTVVVYDTIRIDSPKPYYVEVVRMDTVEILDTVTVTVPIEQKTYKNEDYKVVIEGYKPSLVSLDIYKKTTTIRDTVNISTTITKYKPMRWSLSVGPGIGYRYKGFEPYLGVNVGYVLWSR